MISLEEARRYILSCCPEPVKSCLKLSMVRGLVTAEAVVAPMDIPHFDNTAMDGFAVRSVDIANPPVELKVVGTVGAGVAPEISVGSGEAIRIMTGAAMPSGSDSVVMVERTVSTADGSKVLIEAEVTAGDHVRTAGEDVQAGDEVFPVGTVLGPGHIGVLASLGKMEISVFSRPVVGVISTGDELIEGDVVPLPGQIRDTNRHALLASLEELGVFAVDLGIVPDSETVIEEALRQGVARCDCVLTSGGVSVGDFDYVKAVLDRIGDMRWMQVAIKPAKPLAFGLVEGVPIFGLPGNPVSSIVSFELFARPALRTMMGYSEVDRPRVEAIVEGDLVRRFDGKVHFARVVVSRIGTEYRVSSAGGQGSHQLSAMADADGLAVLPDGEGMTDGEIVEVLLLR